MSKTHVDQIGKKGKAFVAVFAPGEGYHLLAGGEATTRQTRAGALGWLSLQGLPKKRGKTLLDKAETEGK